MPVSRRSRWPLRCSFGFSPNLLFLKEKQAKELTFIEKRISLNKGNFNGSFPLIFSDAFKGGGASKRKRRRAEDARRTFCLTGYSASIEYAFFLPSPPQNLNVSGQTSPPTETIRK
jgi:hypothetical protein